MWNSLMFEHVCSMLHWRNSLAPSETPDPTKAAEMKRHYDEILALAEAEYA
jgi:hypothetical protein